MHTQANAPDLFQFLDSDDMRFLNRIQHRTHANMAALFKQLIVPSMLAKRGSWAAGNDAAPPAMLAFVAREIRYGKSLRRIGDLAADGMPPGYSFFPETDHVLEFILARTNWAVLAWILQSCLTADATFSRSEWLRENERLDAGARDAAVNDLIVLIQGIDVLLLFQADADVDYFIAMNRRRFTPGEIERLRAGVLAAYRFQVIASGMQDPQFAGALQRMITSTQMQRLTGELAPQLMAPAWPSIVSTQQSDHVALAA